MFLAKDCSPPAFQITVVPLLKFCFDRGITFTQCANHKCMADEFLPVYMPVEPPAYHQADQVIEHQHLEGSLRHALLKGDLYSDHYDIGQGHMGFKCNAYISMNSEMCLFACARKYS